VLLGAYLSVLAVECLYVTTLKPPLSLPLSLSPSLPPTLPPLPPGTIRAGAGAIAALYSLRSGYFAVIVRRAYGVGGAMLVDCGAAHPPGGANWRVAWPSAETGSLPLDGGVAAAFKSQLAAAPDPAAALKDLTQRIDNLRSPLRTAAAFSVEDVIRPRDTRPLLCSWVREMYAKLAHGDTLGPRDSGGYIP
jgi:acetyl-CoA carboxylase carboxyltransferase component